MIPKYALEFVVRVAKAKEDKGSYKKFTRNRYAKPRTFYDESGFASGAISSGLSSGASTLDLGNAATVGIGGVSGGIGARLAGGSFFDGMSQGLITSGLNHAAHSGAFGSNLAASLITGKTRHLFSPDELSGSLSLNMSSGANVGMEGGGLSLLRGENKGVYSIADLSAGVGPIEASLTGEVTKLYFSGSKSAIRPRIFYGQRVEVNIAASVGLSAGANLSLAPIDNFEEYVLGIGPSIGISIPGISANINWGASAKNAKTARKIIRKELGRKRP